MNGNSDVSYTLHFGLLKNISTESDSSVPDVLKILYFFKNNYFLVSTRLTCCRVLGKFFSFKSDSVAYTNTKRLYLEHLLFYCRIKCRDCFDF